MGWVQQRLVCLSRNSADLLLIVKGELRTYFPITTCIIHPCNRIYSGKERQLVHGRLAEIGLNFVQVMKGITLCNGEMWNDIRKCPTIRWSVRKMRYDHFGQLPEWLGRLWHEIKRVRKPLYTRERNGKSGLLREKFAQSSYEPASELIRVFKWIQNCHVSRDADGSGRIIALAEGIDQVFRFGDQDDECRFE
jgi:hypothetical protein